MSRPVIALFAKYPRAGEVKTRLIPALGGQGACNLHRRLVERTIATIRQSGLPYVLYCSGAPHGDFADWLGPEVPLVEQGEGDLGERLARVPAPAILLGADIPDLTAQHLRDAETALQQSPVVIGPAGDGGYYLLGLSKPAAFLFDEMAWGTPAVLAQTRQRLSARKMVWNELEMLEDCDRPQDLARWPDLAR